MTALLDANILIALISPSHVHHEAAESWLASADEQFATCPITQGSLVRFAFRQGHPPDTAKALLLDIIGNPLHVFWPDTISYQDVGMDGILGHRQITDAYLAQLARENQGRLATFDRGLAATHSDVVDLVPTG